LHVWVTFDSSGLCSLDSDPTNVVDPNVGFQIKAAGPDAIVTCKGVHRITTLDNAWSDRTRGRTSMPKHCGVYEGSTLARRVRLALRVDSRARPKATPPIDRSV
jgi:hypothetical protein